MTPETLSEYATYFDDGFFLIGAAILLIELLKAFFSGDMKGRKLLDMVASASTQIPYLLVEIFLMSFIYLGMGNTVHFAPIGLHTARRALDLARRFTLARPLKEA